MGRAGLTKTGLERMHRVLLGHVENGEMAGLVALACHNDDVHIEELGTSAIGESTPMRRDTIFRIASLSKVVTAAAAMTLIEECKMRLDEFTPHMMDSPEPPKVFSDFWTLAYGAME